MIPCVPARASEQVVMEIAGMPYVTSNDGIRLFFEDTGHGRPLIMIHSWTFSGRFFSAMRQILLALISKTWPPACAARSWLRTC